MIVTTGRIIKIEIGPNDYLLERSSEAPGRVILHKLRDRKAIIELPCGADAKRLIEAYERILAEDIGYRKQECE